MNKISLEISRVFFTERDFSSKWIIFKRKILQNKENPQFYTENFWGIDLNTRPLHHFYELFSSIFDRILQNNSCSITYMYDEYNTSKKLQKNLLD